MKKTFLLFSMAAAVLIASAALAEEAYYVQSLKARIMSEPSFKASVIAEVPRGYKLTSGERAGAWIKVLYGGRQGYVAPLLVSTHPPLEKTRVIKAEQADISHGVRRRASTFTTAAAARGLTGEDRKRASTEEEVDYGAVERMEALTIPDEEVTRFAEGSTR